MRNPLKVLLAPWLKALTVVRYPTERTWSVSMPNSSRDYAKGVGDGRSSAIVMAPVRWIMRTLPEAPLMQERYLADGSTETVRATPMLALLDSPNPYYDGHLLTMALAGDLALSGNAYVLKVRAGAGNPVELWWAPSSMMEPRWPTDGSAYLTHYDYTPSGVTIRIDPADVIHVRDGLDPKNTRKGLSPLASLLREIFTDNEAANMTASLLANMGVPGLIVSPEEIGRASCRERV